MGCSPSASHHDLLCSKLRLSRSAAASSHQFHDGLSAAEHQASWLAKLWQCGLETNQLIACMMHTLLVRQTCAFHKGGNQLSSAPLTDCPCHLSKVLEQIESSQKCLPADVWNMQNSGKVRGICNWSIGLHGIALLSYAFLRYITQAIMFTP